jgi:hypothetical protein
MSKCPAGVAAQLHLVLLDDTVLQRQRGHGSNSANGINSVAGALGENLRIDLLEFLFDSHAEKSRGHGKGHGRGQGDECELPAKVKRYRQAAYDTEYGNGDEGHVYPEQLMQLGGIIGNQSSQWPRRATGTVEPGDVVGDQVAEVLDTIRSTDVLYTS